MNKVLIAIMFVATAVYGIWTAAVVVQRDDNDKLLEAAENLMHSKETLQNQVVMTMKKRALLIDIASLSDFYYLMSTLRSECDRLIVYAYSDNCKYSKAFSPVILKYISELGCRESQQQQPRQVVTTPTESYSSSSSSSSTMTEFNDVVDVMEFINATKAASDDANDEQTTTVTKQRDDDKKAKTTITTTTKVEAVKDAAAKGELVFVRLNTRTVQELKPAIKSYGAVGTPALLGFKAGVLVKCHTGIMDENEIAEFVDALSIGC